MALASTTLWELNASATANNVNGGGFNYNNANFLTDLTTDAATGNTASPVISSASYNFVAGDIGNWVYVRSGTNWYAGGLYQIASVAANKATLSAGIGQGIVLNTSTKLFSASTVVGVASVATPTNGTFGVDYSQSTAATINGVADFAAVGASTTLTSASAPFTRVMVGNIYHQTTTGTGGFGTVGWYEIVNYTNTTTVVLDRAPNGGTASVDCTGYVGGAMSMNSTLDDECLDSVIAGNSVFIKSGTFATGEPISTVNSGGSVTGINFIGYITNRATIPTGTNRPTFSYAANTFTFSSYWHKRNVIFTGTTSQGINLGLYSKNINCRFVNTSTTASRQAVNPQETIDVGCEYISYRGYGTNAASGPGVVAYIGCYFHDSDVLVRAPSTDINVTLIDCLLVGAVTSAINSTAGVTLETVISGCTVFGALNTRGLGIVVSGSVNTSITNTIVSGCTTGITGSGGWAQYGNWNDFYNNDTNTSNWNLGPNDSTANPQFTNVGQLTGATATTSGSVLTQAGGDFSTVTDNVDFLYLVSGTGVTAGKYLITAHGATTVTLDIAPGTDATANKVWEITTGNNFQIGTNLKALGFPGAFTGSSTTGYLDMGAAQRQEAGGGGGGNFTFA